MMDKMTITEALSEINLIKKKIMAKQAKIQSAVIRAEHLPDSFTSEGGSEEMIRRESQGIYDLNYRLARIRAEISHANLTHKISIGEDVRSIHDWLIWKREIATGQIKFTRDIHESVRSHNKTAAERPQVYKDGEDKPQLVKYKINVDYADWLQRETLLSEKLEKLDGQLSLKNATICIEI